MQEAIISCIASTDPRHDPNDAKKLEAISEAIQHGEVWLEQEEWRISTWFDTKIAKIVRDGKDWYQVAVTCDRQTFSGECYSLEKAFAFMHLYKQLIIDQFYSVGPAWAYNSLLEL